MATIGIRNRVKTKSARTRLAVNSINVVYILLALSQTVRSMARVVFTTQAYPALRLPSASILPDRDRAGGA